MKKFFALIMAMICMLSFAACAEQERNEENLQQDFVPSQHVDVEADLASQEISNVAVKNDFELKLYADKATYAVDEEIQIRATLEYKGEKDTVTIWHGDPYLTFSITDGKDFETGGLVMTILTSTELEKGKIYEFAYQKSGGFSESDPNADFWREFYQTSELKLPAGTYTVTADCGFSLSEDRPGDDDGPSCELQITVTDATAYSAELEQTEVVDDVCPYAVMVQDVCYVTRTEEAERDSFAKLEPAGEVELLIPPNQMPTENFQSNAFEVGSKLWLGDGQLLIESDEPDVFWVFQENTGT